MSSDRPDQPYRLLSTTSRFAFDRLHDAGEVEETKSRHAEFFSRIAQKAFAELEGDKQGFWLLRLDGAHNDLRASLRWVSDRPEAHDLLEFVRNMQWYWLRQGHLKEGLAWSEAALSRADSEVDEVASMVMGRAAALAGAQFQFNRA